MYQHNTSDLSGSPEYNEFIKKTLKAIELLNDEQANDGEFMHMKLEDAIRQIGPGCVYDDFQNVEQIKGGLIMMDWIIKFMDV